VLSIVWCVEVLLLILRLHLKLLRWLTALKNASNDYIDMLLLLYYYYYYYYIIIILSITNKMQRYTIFFVTVNALHVSGGFSAHHQELKNCTHSIGDVSSLLAATASLTYPRCCVYSFWAPDDGRRIRLKHVEHWQ